MARRIPTAEARKDFATVLRDSARGERIKLTRYDKTVAVVVSTDDFARLVECEQVLGPAPRRRAVRKRGRRR